MRRRSRTGLLPIGLLVLWPSIGPGPIVERSLIGRLTDGRGDAIPGVTVYVRAVEDGGPGVTRVLRSDTDGSFAATLPAGRYVVAALKPGYDVSMTEVNTHARPIFKLRMKESHAIRLGNLPVGPAGANLGTGWILRRRHSDVLRDDDPVIQVLVSNGTAAGDQPGTIDGPGRPVTGAAGALIKAVDGEFEQRWGGEDLFGGDAKLAAVLGRSTTLALDGPIGEQGEWRFDGRLGRSSAEADGAARLEHRSDGMAVGLDSTLGPRDRVEANVRYGRGRYAVGAGDGRADLTNQESRFIGLGSRWGRALGEGVGLHVDAAFVEAAARLPESNGSSPGLLPGEGAGRDRLIDRTWLGGVGIALEEGDHHVDVGIRARAYRFDLREQGVLLAALGRPPGLAELGDNGRAMSLTAADRWQFGDRSHVEYGVSYHTGSSSDGGYIVPQVGMRWTPRAADGLTVRSAIIMLLSDGGSASTGIAPAEHGAAGRSETDRVGYRIGIERRGPDRLQIAATLSDTMVDDSAAGGREASAAAAWGDAPLFVSDGAARHREMGLELARDFGAVRGGFEGAMGRVEGQVTPAVEQAPVQILENGAVRYYRAQAWAQYGPTETELQIDYRHVQGQPDAASAPGSLDYRQVDFVVYQDLPAFRSLGSARLRLLMAYQDLIYGSLYDQADGAPTSGSASRLTGGVHIFF